MNTQNSLKSYCEDLYVDIQKRLEDAEDDSEGKVLLTVYQDKCKSILSALGERKSGKSSESQASTIWQEIARLVLDVTYVEEVNLVEDEFPEATVESRVKYILESLTSLEVTVAGIHPEKSATDYLGSEIMECIQWRRGALLYMFCHTIQGRQTDLNFPSHYVHYLEDGIDFLIKMLKTRSPPQWLESSGDGSSPSGSQLKTDTLQLIEQGIFSDTHLLALMYCGELCYWYSNVCCKEDKNASILTNTSDRKERCLSKEQSSPELKQAEMTKTLGSCCISTSAKVPTQPSECQFKDESSPGQVQQVTTKAMHKELGPELDKKEKSSTATQKSDDGIKQQFRIVSIGNSCLKKYLSIANGPLVGAGWSSSRAEEILLHFEKLKL